MCDVPKGQTGNARGAESQALRARFVLRKDIMEDGDSEQEK